MSENNCTGQGFLGEWDRIAVEEGTNRSSLDHGYFLFYEALLCHKPIDRMLELGIHEGAGIRTWRRIFPDATVVGVDINAFEPVPGAHLYRGDCTHVETMTDVALKHGPFDFIVDDASHQPEQIAASLDVLAPLLDYGGTYVVEDTLLADPNDTDDPWYARTADVVIHARSLGFQPLVITPGCRFDRHDQQPIPDRGPWALVVMTRA